MESGVIKSTSMSFYNTMDPGTLGVFHVKLSRPTNNWKSKQEGLCFCNIG